MNRVVVILRKEWLELRGDRLILLGTLLPPLLLAALALATVYLTGRASESGSRPPPAPPGLEGAPTAEILQGVLGQQMGLLFLLLPLLVPGVIASYSIVGEKAGRTLEPLLATPVHTWELLLGKSLAALLPALGLTWTLGAVFVAGVRLTALSERVFAAIVSPAWILVLLLCTPALALITVALIVAISSRVNDPRTAQQITVVLVLPLMGLSAGQVTGLLVLNPLLALGAAAILALIAAGAIWLASRLFRRETILTRWR